VIDREWIVKKTLFVFAMIAVLGILLIVVLVTQQAAPSIVKAGPLQMLFSSNWSPQTGHYGMLIFIAGTFLTMLGGLLIGVPLALGTAIFLTQMASKRIAAPVSRAVEIMAGIPSIVIGWLGLTMLVPTIRKVMGTNQGYGLLAASLVLGVMIMPTITAIAKDALEAVPVAYKQASIGLGATRWQTIRRVILPAARNGIVVAVILGMGRAIGETVAVAMVLGPSTAFPKSLTTPTHTLTTKIVMEIGESTGLQRSALFAMALLLLLIAMALILSVRLVTRNKEFA
jgi:phosphate ABC transporter permease protein PstC